MGMHAAIKTGKAVDYLRSNIARLSIFARQAVGILKIGDKLSPPTQEIYGALSHHIPFVEEDRSLHDDIEHLEELLKNRAFDLHSYS